MMTRQRKKESKPWSHARATHVSHPDDPDDGLRSRAGHVDRFFKVEVVAAAKASGSESTCQTSNGVASGADLSQETVRVAFL
jgi:hypothetical protein